VVSKVDAFCDALLCGHHEGTAKIRSSQNGLAGA
jgi:hypothetical protein